MKLIFHAQAWDDYLYWQRQDRKLLKRLNGLIQECCRTPFEGTGKPEPLKGNWTGYWSRRITQEHRLIYKVKDDCIFIAMCRMHYE